MRSPESFTAPVKQLLNACSTMDLSLDKRDLVLCDSPSDGALNPSDLFPAARSPEAAFAGLLLRLGHWDAAHTASDIESRDAYYWHAIIHRIEPDSWNSGYWFRKVGRHPIFPELRERASELLAGSTAHWKLKDAWDSTAFIALCDEARATPGSDKAQLATAIQKAEWELLFSWCASIPS